MRLLSRRHCLRTFAGAATAQVLTPFGSASATPSPHEEEAIAGLAQAYLKQSRAPALSVAFAKGGRLIYSAAFGMADAERGEKATPAHRFRIASLSKPITSAAIYLMIEQGRLKLDDKVFGDLLALDVSKAASPEAADITLHHLLTHTGGGWNNKANDPMFQHPEMNHADLINMTLQTRRLDSAPGKVYAYSNFGYCVLGRVIEKISGTSYADYVQANVLAPCGIKDMQIAGNTLAERADQEVVYQGQDGQKPYSMNIRRLDSHGGWMATPIALVHFLTHVDDFGDTSDILRPATLKTMTTPTAANPNYASGFAVNAAPNWWHTGSLPGTTAILVRTASGMCWAGITNSRGAKDPSLDRLMWQMAKAVPAWNA